MNSVNPAAFLIITTCSSTEEANRISATLIENKLAACVQVVGPVTSHFYWDGGLQQETEWQCQIKTTPTALDSVKATIASLHSYDVPEIIALPVTGSKPYLGWIHEQVRQPKTDEGDLSGEAP